MADAGVNAGETVEVPKEDAQLAAVAAWRRGDLIVARQLSQALLAADGRDPLAHYVLALSSFDNDDLRIARTHARLAFRYGRTDVQKHQAAITAANIASAEKRDLALRFWLRQATETAPTPEVRARGIATIDAVRRKSPWSTSLRFSVTPSNNVNGGSNSPFNVIDGVPFVGVLDPDAQALSGLVTTLQGRIGYRLRETSLSQTQIGASLGLKRVSLSSGARDKAITLTGKDLATTDVDFSLDHRFRTEGMNGSISLSLGLGFGLGYDSDLDGNSDFSRRASLDVSRRFALGKSTLADLGAGVEIQEVRAGTRPVSTTYQVSGTLRRGFQNGDIAGVSLAFFATDADRSNERREGLFVRGSYDFGNALGPFLVSGAVGGSMSRYADYTIGFIRPPGGRQDVSIFGEVSLTAKDLSWAGFAPELTLRASRTNSNISRFDQNELGLVFGIKSLF